MRVGPIKETNIHEDLQLHHVIKPHTKVKLKNMSRIMIKRI